MASLRLLLALTILMLFRPTTARLCPPVRKCLAAKECPLLPVPKKSLATPVGPSGFRLTLLRPGVYSYTDGAYFTLVLYKDRHLTLIDFPSQNSPSFRNGEYLLITAVKTLLRRTRPKRLDMVYTHRHFDHIGGAGIFFSFIQKRYPGLRTFVWGTVETRMRLARNDMSALPKINLIVGDNGRTVNLAPSLNVKLIIIGGHTQSDLVAHVQPSREGKGIVHFVDFVTTGFVPFLDFGLTTDLERYIGAHELVLSLPFKVASTGHGKLATAEDIQINLRYTKDVIKFRREAAKEVTPQMLADAGLGLIGDPTAVQFGNGGLASKVPLDLQAEICSRKIIKKYGCSPGAADLFGRSHCKEAFFFDTIEIE